MQDLSMHSCCAGPWLQEFTDLRDKINTAKLEIEIIRSVVAELDVRIPKTGRNYPIPKLSERALARMEREAAMAGRSSFLWSRPSCNRPLQCIHAETAVLHKVLDAPCEVIQIATVAGVWGCQTNAAVSCIVGCWVVLF